MNMSKLNNKPPAIQCHSSGSAPPRRKRSVNLKLLLGLVLSCTAICACAATEQETFSVSSDAGSRLAVTALAEFDQPWAMSFLPSGELLVTEKSGRLWMISSSAVDVDTLGRSAAQNIERVEVLDVPQTFARGQGGLGDVLVHPDYENNSLVYLSYVEREGDISGAVVSRARLDRSDPDSPQLISPQIIWRQQPKVTGNGHYGHRLAFSEDGYLFITSGERQKFDPAQDMQMNLGKVLRLFDDGSVPSDNPWADLGGIAAQFWSIGHRNPLGIAFENDGDLWVHEMGPRGGDELNRIIAGENYGYPLVSNGSHYSGVPIPDHDTRPELRAPEISWTPVISPSSLIVYEGNNYPGWQGTALIGGLSSQSLVRVSLDEPVSELERFDMHSRIREVEEYDDGVVFLLEDKAGGRLLRLEAP
jgi:glucose/arabinose dehydrogenase